MWDKNYIDWNVCPLNAFEFVLKIAHPTQEDGVSRVFAKYGFRYPVEISMTTVGEDGCVQQFPYIRPSNFIAAMSKTGDLHRLLGGMKSMKQAKPLLSEFWKRWKAGHPKHSVFSSGVPLDAALPFYIHGDEGTHFKKSAVLVASFQSALGYGSVRRPLEKALPPEIEQAGIPLNFLRTALQTRFLVALAPKDLGFQNKHVILGVFTLVGPLYQPTSYVVSMSFDPCRTFMLSAHRCGMTS